VNGYIFIFSLLIVSEFFVTQTGINIPGSILGLILLFIYFYIKKDIPHSIESSAKTLLKYLPLMLVPIGVGMKELFTTFDAKLIAMLAASIVSLILAVFITVFTIWIIKYFLNHFTKKRKES
jgi:holin-like protein